jgi:phage-related protein
MDKDILKPVRWIGPSYNHWKAFPDEVQDVMGYALYQAQQGKKAANAKPLKGFKGASVLEIVDDFDNSTWRAVYTVQFKEVIYVLHAFQKKSKQGIATPKADIKLINQRLKQAKLHYETNQT